MYFWGMLDLDADTGEKYFRWAESLPSPQRACRAFWWIYVQVSDLGHKYVPVVENPSSCPLDFQTEIQENRIFSNLKLLSVCFWVNSNRIACSLQQSAAKVPLALSNLNLPGNGVWGATLIPIFIIDITIIFEEAAATSSVYHKRNTNYGVGACSQ